MLLGYVHPLHLIHICPPMTLLPPRYRQVLRYALGFIYKFIFMFQWRRKTVSTISSQRGFWLKFTHKPLHEGNNGDRAELEHPNQTFPPTDRRWQRARCSLTREAKFYTGTQDQLLLQGCTSDTGQGDVQTSPASTPRAWMLCRDSGTRTCGRSV